MNTQISGGGVAKTVIQTVVAGVVLAILAIIVVGDRAILDRWLAACNPWVTVLVVGAVVVSAVAAGVWLWRGLVSLGRSRRNTAALKTMSACLAIVWLAYDAEAYAPAPVQITASATTGPITRVVVVNQSGSALTPEQLSDVASLATSVAGPGVPLEYASEVPVGDTPHLAIAIETAVGLIIAAIILGVVLFIIIRAICKGLRRLGGMIRRKQCDDGKTNSTDSAASFVDRGFTVFASTNQVFVQALAVMLAVPDVGETSSPVVGRVLSNDMVQATTFISSLGLSSSDALTNSFSVGGVSVSEPESRITQENGEYWVKMPGYTNLVSMAVDRGEVVANATNWTHMITVHLPVGAKVDWGDATLLTMPNNLFYRFSFFKP